MWITESESFNITYMKLVPNVICRLKFEKFFWIQRDEKRFLWKKIYSLNQFRMCYLLKILPQNPFYRAVKGLTLDSQAFGSIFPTEMSDDLLVN